MMNKIILLVDDDPIFNWVSTKLIEKHCIDLTITTLLDGKKALDFLKENYTEEYFYYIFLDINMPLLNGWGFLDALKKMSSIKSDNVSIHIVSSSTDKSDQQKAKSYPLVQGFINKPLSLENIKSILQD